MRDFEDLGTRLRAHELRKLQVKVPKWPWDMPCRNRGKMGQEFRIPVLDASWIFACFPSKLAHSHCVHCHVVVVLSPFHRSVSYR